MRIKYDENADTLYIRLRESEYYESDEIKEGFILDYDADSMSKNISPSTPDQMKSKLTSFEHTLQKIDNICNENNLEYIVIDGVAIMYHLEFRTTKDIDISLCLEFTNIRVTGEIFFEPF